MKYLETVIHMIVARSIMYLSESGCTDIREKFPRLCRMADRLTREELEAWAGAHHEAKARYERMLEIIGDAKEPDHVLESVLDLCLAQMYAPEFAAFLKYYTGASVTLRLAYDLEEIRFPDAMDMHRKLCGLSRICYIDWKNMPVCHQELYMDDRIFEYLMGSEGLICPDGRWFEVFDHRSRLQPLFVHEELARRGADHLSTQGRLLMICGQDGRRFIARHIGLQLKADFVFADIKAFGQCKSGEFSRKRMELIREALLCGGGVCIYGVTKEALHTLEMDEGNLTQLLVMPILNQEISLILCMDANIQLWARPGEENILTAQSMMLRLNIPLPDHTVRDQVWRGFSGLYDMPLDCSHFAERYQLSPSEIARVLLLWRERYPDKRELRGEFSRLCYDAVCMGMEDKIGKVIYPEVSMEDLKVSEDIQDILEQAVASVKGRRRIYEEWQMKRKYPYGRAVTVLLTGPPGTGKTMSAHAIANRLGIPLYQVNLSNVVDKYIGETEKHLEQAFSFAEKTSMVLFFDEADSLFGKRSEVSDARDKYANTEISYLLQRIEQFDGIAIMATNFINNIDTAFLRRIKYVVRFRQPDEQQRLAIWESCMLSTLPALDIDLAYLARQFDFSGGTIKNILLNACAIAVKEDTVLDMEHILKAIRDEYTKMERMIDNSIWGEYEYLFI